MPRPKKYANEPIKLRLTDPQEALIAEVQVWAGANSSSGGEERELYGRGPTVRRILDAVVVAMRDNTPISILLPIDIARLMPVEVG